MVLNTRLCGPCCGWDSRAPGPMVRMLSRPAYGRSPFVALCRDKSRHSRCDRNHERRTHERAAKRTESGGLGHFISLIFAWRFCRRQKHYGGQGAGARSQTAKAGSLHFALLRFTSLGGGIPPSPRREPRREIIFTTGRYVRGRKRWNSSELEICLSLATKRRGGRATQGTEGTKGTVACARQAFLLALHGRMEK
jgi:hypothetical protein